MSGRDYVTQSDYDAQSDAMGALITAFFPYGKIASFGGRLIWGAKGYDALSKGGLSFTAYKASRGGTKTLGWIDEGLVASQRISVEYHHMFLTQRLQKAWGLPNWAVNNRLNVWKLNTIQHSLLDPYRKQFLRADLKLDVGFFKKYNFFTSF